MSIEVIILAAGKSRRMQSKKSKVLHRLLGKPLIHYPIKAARQVMPNRIYIVVGGPHAAEVEAEVKKYEGVTPVYQNEPLGTGHAVMQVSPYIQGKDVDILIMPGDAPLVTGETLKKLYELHRKNDALATILTAEVPDPTGYGRIIRSRGDRVLMIVEEADAFPEEKQIKEVNSGIYIFDSNILLESLSEIKPDNKQGEYYLTDVIAIIQRRYGGVYAYRVEDWREIVGVNTRKQLSDAHRILLDRIVNRHLSAGVSILDPGNVYIEEDVVIEPDVVVHPCTSLIGNTYIEEGSEVGPNALLENVRVKKNSRVAGVYLKDTTYPPE